MARLAHGGAAIVAALALLVTAGAASANTITTVAGGGTQTPPTYEQYNTGQEYVYANPRSVALPSPRSVVWSGDPKGLFFVVPGGGQCGNIWVDPDPTTQEYGLAVWGGSLTDCNARAGGYFGNSPATGNPWVAKEVLLKNPCCVTSDWNWDRTALPPGPFVASSDSGHVQFYRWKDNQASTVGGSNPPANCGDPTLQPVADGTAATTAGFCAVTALAQQGFSGPNVAASDWWAFVERNRGNNSGILYWVDSIDQVHPILLDGSHPNLPQSIGGLAWDQLTGIDISGPSAIHRLQRSGGFWTDYVLAGSTSAPGFAGDGGPPSNARFNEPHGLAVGFDQALYIADTNNCRIRKLSKITLNNQNQETVTTVAGNGCDPGAPLGDGGSATDANLDHPLSVAMASTGLLIADTGHDVIRLLDRTSIVNPASATADTTPSFDVRSLDSPSNIECKLDSVVTPCDNLGTVSEGQHTLTARELGGSAPSLPDPPDPTPAVATFVVDTSAPTGVTLTSPAADATGVSLDPDFTWTAGTDAHSGIDHYELWIGDQKNRDVPTSACSGGTCVAKAAAPLAEGGYTWEVRPVDRAGNTGASDKRNFSAGGAPVAAFTISPNPALVGRAVTFDGSGSSDPSGISRFEWDLDGDGSFEEDNGPAPTTTRAYAAPATLQVTLRVTDGTNKTSTVTQTLRITSPPGASNLLGVSINNGAQFTRTPDVTLTVKAPANSNAFVVSNDGGFFAPATFPAATSIKWKLDSSGPERLPKTVYLRFLLGPIVSDNYTDDIILDEIPPVVQSASLAKTASASGASVARAKTYTVKVKAKDSNSGVAKVQVTANKRKPGRLLAYKTKLKVKGAKPKFLRARDRAGNYSKWRKLR